MSGLIVPSQIVLVFLIVLVLELVLVLGLLTVAADQPLIPSKAICNEDKTLVTLR